MKKKLLINDVIFPGIYELKNQDSTARRFRDRRLMDLWEAPSWIGVKICSFPRILNNTKPRMDTWKRD